MERHLRQTLQALRAACVRTVVLKGPVLAERLYRDASLRFSSDLDFLIAPDDLERAASALAPLGYQLQPESSAWYYRRHHHHLCLDAPHRPTVELHFRAFTGFGAQIEAHEFLRRARPYRTRSEADCEVLAAEDEFLFLALHAAGHAFERLAWLYDLKMLLRRHPELDWPGLVRRAQALGVTRALAFSVHVLRRRLRVERAVAQLPQEGCRRWNAATCLLSALQCTPPASPLFTAGNVVLQALLCDRPGTAARHLRHHCWRILRRRLQSRLPHVFPRKWAA
jgi:hypothetical protein